MITVTKRVALGSVLFLIGACGSSTPGSGDGSDPASTSTTGNCDQFSTCFNRCYCQTQDKDACTAQCNCSQYTTCSEQCYCEKGDLAMCATECASAPPGSGGSTSTGGTTSSGGTTSTGGTTTTGGASTGTGGTTGTGGVVMGTGGVVMGTGGVVTGTGGTTSTWPPPTETYTFTSETFTVAPGGEVYKCQDFANPFGKDVDILYSESFMAPGSHHMFAFRNASYNNNTGLSDCSGLQIDEYIHTAQTPQQIYSYPPGVGRFMSAGDGIRLQAHYINTTTSTITAQISLTVNYVDPSQVQAHAAAIFLNNIGVTAPPGTSTATRTATLPTNGGWAGVPIEVIGAGSHMHRRGINFVANVVGGPQLYTTTDWDEPKGAAFDPPLELAPGSSIQYACTYQNDTNTTMTFGDSAATNEMCIFSGVYYPAPGGISIIINQF